MKRELFRNLHHVCPTKTNINSGTGRERQRKENWEENKELNMLSSQISKLSFVRPHLHGSVSALAMRLKSTTIDSQCPPVKTRPKRPMAPFQRFISERNGLSKQNKERAKKWKEMTDEEKRPFIKESEARKELWEAENATMLAQIKAIKESGKFDSRKLGYTMFISEAQIPYDPIQYRLNKASEMWRELTEEERTTYQERAKDLNEKGLEELEEAAMKKMAKRFLWDPYRVFLKQSDHETMKGKSKEARLEWEGLSNDEKRAYTERYEEERQQYHTKIEEYKEGTEFKEQKKAVSIIKAKIKKLEKEMNKPKRGVNNSYSLYMKEMKETVAAAGKSWKALSEEEKAVYKRRYEELKSKWQEDVAEWELKNADTPKMTELKAAVKILKSQN